MLPATIGYHNAPAVGPVDGREGYRLQRVPERIRESLNEEARYRMLCPAASELRFRTAGRSVSVTFSCPDGVCEVVPYWGAFEGRARYRIANECRTILLSLPERLANLDPAALADAPFSLRLWRLLVRGEPVFIHDITGNDLRPPEPTDVPDRRCLAYGTSITEGWSASSPALSYASLVARELDADLINLGSSGSAYCEPELARYIAERDDWDWATFELSVNMLRAGFSLSEFRKRATTFVNLVARAHPSKPVVCISLFPFFGDLSPGLEEVHWRSSPEAYRRALQEIVAEAPSNVTFLDGRDALSDPTGLGPDLLHPSDHGMRAIAREVSATLRSCRIDG